MYIVHVLDPVDAHTHTFTREGTDEAVGLILQVFLSA